MRKIFKIIKSFFLILIFFFLFSSSLVKAQGPTGSPSDFLVKITPPTSLPQSLRSLEKAIPKIFDIIIYSAAIVFLLLFLIGGISYLTAAGNEEATKKAKRFLIDAIIGLIIVLIAWAAGTWLLKVLGLPIVSNTI